MGKFKYKLKEKDFEVGDVNIKNDIESTITNIDSKTGAISWDIKNLPNVQTVFKKFKDLSSSINSLDRDTDDGIIDDINAGIKKLFNEFRTHIRKNYSDLYKKISETSISNGAGSYLSKAGSPAKTYKYKLKEVEESSKQIFQRERVEAFDTIERRLIDIKKKLRQGKLATIKYYRQNPDKWEVVYGTDLINDYFNDIEKLLSDNN